MERCKYCNSKNLILVPRIQNQNVMDAAQVALVCADCGKWLKWCPKDEREFYIKANQGYQDYQEICHLEEYQRWADKEITRLNKELAITDNALALAVETMRYELGRTAIKNLYELALKNYKGNPKMTFDYDMCDWFKDKSKELRAEYKIRLNNYRENFEIVLPARQNGKTKLMRWKLNQVLNEKAVEELEKVNEILTDTIIEITKDEMDLNKLCYLEEISAEF